MKYLKFFNVIFIRLQALFFMGIAAQLYFADNSFSELSDNLYGKDAPLMDSYLIEYLANKFVSITFFVISSFGLYKTLTINTLKNKLLLNIILNLVYIFIGAVLIMLLYNQ